MTKQSGPLSSVLAACSIVVALAACGGGGGPGDAFCHDYAAAFCKKMIQCEPGTGNPAEAECTTAFAKLCSDPPPAGTTMDVNCSGGKQVDSNAKSACLSKLSSVTCDEFAADTYLGTCAQVCTTATGAGGSGAGGTGGTGGGGTGGKGGAGGTGGTGGTGTAPANLAGFCQLLWPVQCEHSYKCASADDLKDPIFIALFGSSLSECKGNTEMIAACSSSGCPGGSYNASLAQTCLAKAATMSCGEGPLSECDDACPQ